MLVKKLWAKVLLELFIRYFIYFLSIQAKCLDTEEIVAVKKVLQDKQYKNRELEILKDLVHPNILGLKHHFFTSDQDVLKS